jgi:hypothetical protein
MRVWPAVAAGLAVAVILWTGPVVGQSKPSCDAQGRMKAPEKVEGQVVKMEPAQSRTSVRESGGTVHEFQAAPETLRDLKVGDHIEAKLREAPKCP